MNRLTLTFGTKEYDCRLGLGFLNRALKNTESDDVQDLMNKFAANPFEMLPVLIFESASHGCYRNKKEVYFTLEDITNEIDDAGGWKAVDLMVFMEAFKNSISNEDVPVEKPDPSTRGRKVVAKKK